MEKIMKYHYHIIIFRPSEYMRVDQVAVGIAVNKGDNIDIRMPYQPKISALLPSITPQHIEEARQSLVDLASHDVNFFMDELPHMSPFKAVSNKQGWFIADSQAEYEKQVDNTLIRRLSR